MGVPFSPKVWNPTNSNNNPPERVAQALPNAICSGNGGHCRADESGPAWMSSVAGSGSTIPGGPNLGLAGIWCMAMRWLRWFVQIFEGSFSPENTSGLEAALSQRALIQAFSVGCWSSFLTFQPGLTPKRLETLLVLNTSLHKNIIWKKSSGLHFGVTWTRTEPVPTPYLSRINPYFHW